LTARPAPDYLRTVFNRLERFIEDRWQVPVVIRDVPNPFTGDLDGEQIMVDYDLEIEDALFILIHLFGHTVQWNASAQRREVAFLAPTTWTDDQLHAAMEYEAESCRYSLQLLHEAGIRDLDQWISDFAACDSRYLLHYYRTGEKRPFRSFWHDGAAILPPLAIPDFRPTRWVSRAQGTVV
jgi:hypothetical protein